MFIFSETPEYFKLLSPYRLLVFHRSFIQCSPLASSMNLLPAFITTLSIIFDLISSLLFCLKPRQVSPILGQKKKKKNSLDWNVLHHSSSVSLLPFTFQLKKSSLYFPPEIQPLNTKCNDAFKVLILLCILFQHFT